MRASSLSNLKVIDLLNRHFVPVYARNGDYAPDGDAATDEKAAYQRVFRDFYRLSEENRQAGKGAISVGTVHAYVLSPDARPLDSLHVAEAARPDRLIEMLERTVQSLKTPAGDPVIEPAPQAAAPACEPDALALHVTARYLERRGDDEVPIIPTLGTDQSSQWGALPSEEWLVLEQGEWTKLLPSASISPGSKWQLDAELTARLLRHFYPPSEENDLEKNRIDEQTLTATVMSVQDGVARARLDGRLKMKHPFYPAREDANFVTATLAGFMDIDAAAAKGNATADAKDAPSVDRRIRRLRLATVSGRYGSGNGDQPFGVAVRSVP